MNPKPSPHQEAIDTHSRQAEGFETRYGATEAYGSCFTYSRRRLDEAMAPYLAREANGVLALDVGCGTGHHMAALRRMGYQVSGVDGSERMLEFARANNPGADLRTGEVESLPFAAATFDLILCIEVLRYLPDPVPTIKEIARVLRPGGRCLVTAAPLLNLNGYFLVNRVAARLRPRGLVALRQYFAPSSRGLRRLFEACSFEQVEVHGVYFGPINWVERLAPSILPGLLHAWEPWDRRLSDRLLLRDFANMFLVSAVRS